MNRNSTAANRPAYWAISVPRATPSTFIPNTYTRLRLAAMFTTFCIIEMNIGMRVFCMPMNQPVSP